MSEKIDNGEKPFFLKNKVLYTLLVIVIVVGALVALAVTGNIEVTSTQILDFGKWILGLLIGGHTLQRGTSYIAQALGMRGLVIEPKIEPEPEPVDEGAEES